MRNSYLKIILNSCFTDASSQVDASVFPDASAADGDAALCSYAPSVAEPCLVDVCLSGARTCNLRREKEEVFKNFTFCANVGMLPLFLNDKLEVKSKSGGKQRQLLKLIRVMGKTTFPVTFAEGRISWGQKMSEWLMAKVQLAKLQIRHFHITSKALPFTTCFSLSPLLPCLILNQSNEC